MKPILNRPAGAALIFGAALLSTPALAQAGQTVTPPPVVPTVPQAQQVTPPPVVRTAPTIRVAPSTPIVQAVPAEPEPEATPARATRAAAPVRAERRAARPAPAPVAAPAESVPAPVAETPVQPTPAPVTETVPAEVVPAPAPVAEEPAAPAEAAPADNSLWLWLVGGGLLVLGAIAFLLMRRRRTEYDDYAEEYREEPAVAEAPAAIPVAERPIPRHEPEVAPRVVPVAEDVEIANPVVAAEDASVSAAGAEDLAGVTSGAAPVSRRPWLELGMRPIRAGTMADEALVEIELIVGNAGDLPAEDVRISTFMIPGGQATSEMEALLIARAEETMVPAMTIKAGEGKTLDATLAAPRAEIAAQGDSFSPVVVADARYRLPDGSEGRTSASFRIGLSDEGARIEPISLDRRGMHENVAAELEGVPARA